MNSPKLKYLSLITIIITVCLHSLFVEPKLQCSPSEKDRAAVEEALTEGMTTSFLLHPVSARRTIENPLGARELKSHAPLISMNLRLKLIRLIRQEPNKGKRDELRRYRDTISDELVAGAIDRALEDFKTGGSNKLSD